MSAYTLALNTRRSHLLVTTPTHSYAMPYIGLAIQTPQMPTGQEQFVIERVWGCPRRRIAQYR